MKRKSRYACATAICAALFSSAWAQDHHETATVSLRIVDAVGATDLGKARVEVFKRKYGDLPSQDFARRFENNTAEKIPYDFYELCASRRGFWRSCTEVPVYQPEVWVILGLRLGASGVSTGVVRGCVTGIDPSKSDLWVRLVGIYSGFSVDAKVDQSGKFQVSAPTGKYVVVTTHDERILDAMPISVPTNNSILVDLSRKD